MRPVCQQPHWRIAELKKLPLGLPFLLALRCRAVVCASSQQNILHEYIFSALSLIWAHLTDTFSVSANAVLLPNSLNRSFSSAQHVIRIITLALGTLCCSSLEAASASVSAALFEHCLHGCSSVRPSVCHLIAQFVCICLGCLVSTHSSCKCALLDQLSVVRCWSSSPAAAVVCLFVYRPTLDCCYHSIKSGGGGEN